MATIRHCHHRAQHGKKLKIQAVLGRLLIACLSCILAPAVCPAGPPFRTDDPEPVEYKHWEVELASQGSLSRDERSLTAPQFEINYGVLPDVQLHFLAPLEYVKEEGQPSQYGYGDTELGVKIRFIHETDWRPQVGTFPILILPTGSEEKGLGSGETRVFLPLWLQKSWGPLKTYGGGGYWINPGTGNRNYWFLGWEVQYDLSEYLTLGGELFHQTPSEVDGEGSTGFNVGAIINFSELHHLLLSVGKNFSGSDDKFYYVGYQLTF